MIGHDDHTAGKSQAEKAAATLRGRVLGGALLPGAHLSEATLCAELDLSRNTLREAFRLLGKEGLVVHIANRGVFVASPSREAISDIYRVRQVIECAAIQLGYPEHPAVARMKAAVERGHECAGRGDWLGVGTADIEFHAAIVALADSPRLTALFAQLALELRLAFGLIKDRRALHEPYLHRNSEILQMYLAGDCAPLPLALKDYLQHAERYIGNITSEVAKTR